MTTTKDISTGLRVMIFAIPGFWAILSVAVSVTWLGGQTTQELKQTVETVETIQDKLDESSKVREDTAVKIGKLETKIENLDKKMEQIDNKLDKIIDKLTTP